MKLIKPSTEILTKIDGEQILKDIEIAARTCYKSEGKIEYANLEGDNFEDMIAKTNVWHPIVIDEVTKIINETKSKDNG